MKVVFKQEIVVTKQNWEEFTGGVLRDLDWSNVFAAGGSVLACLAPGGLDWAKVRQLNRI